MNYSVKFTGFQTPEQAKLFSNTLTALISYSINRYGDIPDLGSIIIEDFIQFENSGNVEIKVEIK